MLTYEQELRSLVAADQDPVLSSDEILMLMRTQAPPSKYLPWVAATAYAVGDLVVPVPRTGSVYVVTTAGISGATQPNWGEDTITEGTLGTEVTWALSTYVETPFNMNRAVSQGWKLKAGKCANRYDFRTDVSDFKRDQMFKHCMEMAKMFRRGTYGSIPVQSNYSSVSPVIGNLNPAP